MIVQQGLYPLHHILVLWSLSLKLYSRLTLNFWQYSCFPFTGAGITDVSQHA